ncbi:MAG TPA: penicillin-binding protein 2 [Gammaproteobacteria bacterium]|nr:penicillin-binding protein 2 [Gammaproteobacteria bacterium]
MTIKADFKDIYLEQAVFGSRLLTMVFVILLLTGSLIWRMVELQVVETRHYSTLAKNNRVRLSPLPPTRGLIYDRNGALLAENLPSFSLEITPSLVDNLGNTLQRLRKFLNISEEDIRKFQKLRRSQSRYRSTPLLVGLTEEEVARFYVHRRDFPGVSIQSRTRRSYPFGAMFSHVLGHVGRINSKELEQVETANYRGTARIGKTGIEKFYEHELHGATGFKSEEVNAQGEIIRGLSRQAPHTGTSLVLTLDLNLQQVAIEAMGDNTGAVIAMDPRNGEILALASLPVFDPNPFINGISTADYALLRDSELRPLFNRAIQGQYPPGSTIKMVTGLAALESGVTTADKRMFAKGYYQVPNDARKYRDWRKEGHGWVNLTSAIAQSSDVYFYDLAYKTGIDRLAPFFRKFGLGHRTGIDLPGEASGLVPSREWKLKRYKKRWFPGETLISGIGQGYMLSTPLQLARMTSCLAMRGDCPQPHLLKARIPGSPYRNPDNPDNKIKLKDAAHWDQIIDAMTAVITSPTGTGRRISKNLQWSLAGKTGTSQVFGLKEDEKYDAETLERRLRDHALFVGFAPIEKPQIAVAVVVEHGGHGGVTAAPIARKIIDAWLGSQAQKQGGEQP